MDSVGDLAERIRACGAFKLDAENDHVVEAHEACYRCLCDFLRLKETDCLSVEATVICLLQAARFAQECVHEPGMKYGELRELVARVHKGPEHTTSSQCNNATVAGVIWCAGWLLSPLNREYEIENPVAVETIAKHGRRSIRRGERHFVSKYEKVSILHVCAAMGFASACALLLDLGAFLDPDADLPDRPPDKNGELTKLCGARSNPTPLQLAIYYRQHDAAAVLLQRGARTVGLEEFSTGLEIAAISTSLASHSSKPDDTRGAASSSADSGQKKQSSGSGYRRELAHFDTTLPAMDRKLAHTVQVGARNISIEAVARRSMLALILATAEIGNLAIEQDAEKLARPCRASVESPGPHDSRRRFDDDRGHHYGEFGCFSPQPASASLCPPWKASTPSTVPVAGSDRISTNNYPERQQQIRYRQLMRHVEYLQEGLGIEYAPGRLTRGTKAGYFANEIGRGWEVENGFDVLAPGYESWLTKQNMRGAVPMHYCPSSIWTSLAIAAIARRQRLDPEAANARIAGLSHGRHDQPEVVSSEVHETVAHLKLEQKRLAGVLARVIDQMNETVSANTSTTNAASGDLQVDEPAGSDEALPTRTFHRPNGIFSLLVRCAASSGTQSSRARGPKPHHTPAESEACPLIDHCQEVEFDLNTGRSKSMQANTEDQIGPQLLDAAVSMQAHEIASGQVACIRLTNFVRSADGPPRMDTGKVMEVLGVTINTDSIPMVTPFGPKPVAKMYSFRHQRRMKGQDIQRVASQVRSISKAGIHMKLSESGTGFGPGSSTRRITSIGHATAASSAVPGRPLPRPPLRQDQDQVAEATELLMERATALVTQLADILDDVNGEAGSAMEGGSPPPVPSVAEVDARLRKAMEPLEALVHGMTRGSDRGMTSDEGTSSSSTSSDRKAFIPAAGAGAGTEPSDVSHSLPVRPPGWIVQAAQALLAAAKESSALVTAHAALQGVLRIRGTSRMHPDSADDQERRTGLLQGDGAPADLRSVPSSLGEEASSAKRGSEQPAPSSWSKRQPACAVGRVLCAQWSSLDQHGPVRSMVERSSGQFNPVDGCLLRMMASAPEAGEVKDHPPVRLAPLRHFRTLMADADGRQDAGVTSELDARNPEDEPGELKAAGTGLDLAAHAERQQEAFVAPRHRAAVHRILQPAAGTPSHVLDSLADMKMLGTTDSFYVALLQARDSDALRHAATMALPVACQDRGLDAVVALLAAGAHADAAFEPANQNVGRAILLAASSYQRDPEAALDKVLFLLMRGAKLRGSFKSCSPPRCFINMHRTAVAVAVARGRAGITPETAHAVSLQRPDAHQDLHTSARAAGGAGGGSGSTDQDYDLILMTRLQGVVDNALARLPIDPEQVLHDVQKASTTVHDAFCYGANASVRKWRHVKAPQYRESILRWAMDGMYGQDYIWLPKEYTGLDHGGIQDCSHVRGPNQAEPMERRRRGALMKVARDASSVRAAVELLRSEVAPPPPVPTWLFAGLSHKGEDDQIRVMIEEAYRTDRDRYQRCVHAMGRWSGKRFWHRGRDDRARRLVEFRNAVSVAIAARRSIQRKAVGV